MKRKIPEAGFLPKGFRFLRLQEETEKGDYYWAPARKCYLPVRKPLVVPVPCIRRV